jgi:hypothetical protein
VRVKLPDFNDLSPVEQGLVDWLKAGKRMDYVVSDGVPKESTAANTIRATLIRYLALGGCDACKPPATGVRVWGAWILGDDRSGAETQGLDFEGESLPGDLGLLDCHIPDLILLRSAKLRTLNLSGSTLVQGLDGDRLTTEGAVFLRKAKVDGEILLIGTQIGGDLSCSGAELRATGVALSADGARITGSVFLRDAKIDDEFRLLGAQIGGDFDCSASELRARGDALRADGARITGGLFLCNAKVDGEICLLGAQIGGNLDCDGAELRAKGNALSADGARITGALFLRNGTKVTGRMSLTGAQIGAIIDDPACWPPSIELDRCRYGAFLGDDAPTDAKHRLDWLSRIPTKDGEFWPDPYEHCAKVLREMGHTSDAREILIEKERLQRKARRKRMRMEGQRPLSILIGLGDWLLGITTRYGRQPLLAFVWLLGFWGFGALWFDQAAQRGEIKPNLPQMQVHPAWVQCAPNGARRGEHISQPACFAAQPEGQSYPRFNALIYSADTLFPVVTLEMQSYWIPDDSHSTGAWARTYLWLHIAMGWALTLLAVAGFSGLIKTDSK